MLKGLSRWDWPEGVGASGYGRAELYFQGTVELVGQSRVKGFLSPDGWWVVEQPGERPDFEHQKATEKAGGAKAQADKRMQQKPETAGTRLPSVPLEEFSNEWVPIAELFQAQA